MPPLLYMGGSKFIEYNPYSITTKIGRRKRKKNEEFLMLPLPSDQNILYNNQK